jgi:hypothetical protein
MERAFDGRSVVVACGPAPPTGTTTSGPGASARSISSGGPQQSAITLGIYGHVAARLHEAANQVARLMLPEA